MSVPFGRAYVRRVTSVPSAFMPKRLAWYDWVPSTSLVNTIRLPSGAQAGSAWTEPPLASTTRFVPSSFMRATSEPTLSVAATVMSISLLVVPCLLARASPGMSRLEAGAVTDLDCSHAASAASDAMIPIRKL
jgi:hypothetical protein